MRRLIIAIALLACAVFSAQPGLRLPWNTVKQINVATGTSVSACSTWTEANFFKYGRQGDSLYNLYAHTIHGDTFYGYFAGSTPGVLDTFDLKAGWGILFTIVGDTMTISTDSTTFFARLHAFTNWTDQLARDTAKAALRFAERDSLAAKKALDTARVALARRDTLTEGWAVNLTGRAVGQDTVSVDSATIDDLIQFYAGITGVSAGYAILTHADSSGGYRVLWDSATGHSVITSWGDSLWLGIHAKADSAEMADSAKTIRGGVPAAYDSASVAANSWLLEGIDTTEIFSRDIVSPDSVMFADTAGYAKAGAWPGAPDSVMYADTAGVAKQAVVVFDGGDSTAFHHGDTLDLNDTAFAGRISIGQSWAVYDSQVGLRLVGGFCGGDSSNRNLAHLSFIGGGLRNFNSGSRSFIGGGESLVNTGEWGFLGGGAVNANAGYGGFIGGGNDNDIAANGSYSAIPGGVANFIGGYAGFIGAGAALKVTGDYSAAFGHSVATDTVRQDSLMALVAMRQVICSTGTRGTEKQFVKGNVLVSDTSRAAYFAGNGSLLTNLPGGDSSYTDLTVEGMGLNDTIGLLNTFGYLNSGGRISGGTITAGGGTGKVIVSPLIGFTKLTNTDTGAIKYFTTAQCTLTMVDSAINYIFVYYNAGTPRCTSTTNRATIRTTDQFTLGRVYRLTADLDVMQMGTSLVNYQRRQNERLLARGNMEHMSGGELSEVATRRIKITSGVYYVGNDKLTTPDFSSDTINFEHYYYKYLGAWTEVAATGKIDSLQYNVSTLAGSESLATLGAGRFGVHWIYLCYGGDLNVIYGRGNYNTLAAAETSSAPATVPDYIAKFNILVGRVIIAKSASTFSNITSAWQTAFASSPVTSHNNLGGLDGGQSGEYYHLTLAQHSAYLAGGVPYGTKIDWFGAFAAKPAGYVLADGINYVKYSATESLLTKDLRKKFTVGADLDTLGYPASHVEGGKALTIGGSNAFTPEGTLIISSHGVLGSGADFVSTGANDAHEDHTGTLVGTTDTLAPPYVATWPLLRSYP